MKKEGTMSVCAECGGDYYAPPSHREKRSFCSRPCKAKAQSKWQVRDVAERFWEKVDKSGDCWLWTAGCLTAGGYGSIRINGKAERAHRVAYTLTVGPIPDGMLLRHTCDNPKCVNPAHLLFGGKRENTKDALERGQHVVGEKHYKAKLQNHAIATIRSALAAGVPGKYLAKQFGVDQTTISSIKLGKKWKYV
jgi:hypothetical protein